MFLTVVALNLFPTWFVYPIENSATAIPSVSVDGIMRKGVASAATKTIAKDINILKAERCLFYAEEIRRRPNQKQFWVQHTTAVILRSKH